jgi:hypothetical protein
VIADGRFFALMYDTNKCRRSCRCSSGKPAVYVVARWKSLGSVLTLPSHKGATAGDHPAVFPVALPREYLRSLTDRGDAVVDPFAGSGSTLIACEELGRRCYAMEIEPRYCDVIRSRYAAYALSRSWSENGSAAEVQRHEPVEHFFRIQRVIPAVSGVNGPVETFVRYLPDREPEIAVVLPRSLVTEPDVADVRRRRDELDALS